MDNDTALSRGIELLRFPLACLIVFGHANPIKYIPRIDNDSFLLFDYSWIKEPITLLGWVLYCPAVPLFFVFSGFLFFWKTDIFTHVIYKKKIKSRIYTLFLPYLTWNTVFLCMRLFIDYRNGNLYGIEHYLVSLWFCPEHWDNLMRMDMTTPLDGPLWFLRDLMVVIVLTPIIYKIVNNNWILAVFITVTAGWYMMGLPFQYWLPGFSLPAFLFFTIGAFFGVNKINVVEVFEETRKIIVVTMLWATMVILDSMTSTYIDIDNHTREIVNIPIVHGMVTLIGMLVYLLFAAKIVKWRSRIMTLGGVSFVVYSLHMFIVHRLWKYLVLNIFTNNPNQIDVLLLYLLDVGLTVFICIVVATLIKRNIVLNVLFTGNRQK